MHKKFDKSNRVSLFKELSESRLSFRINVTINLVMASLWWRDHARLSVLGASLNMADAEAVVRELVARVAADRGITAPAQIRALSSGGANYTSVLFTITLDNLKLFAKVACIGEKMRQTMNAELLFKTEQFVYKDLVKTYTDILAKHENVRPFRFPKIYASLPDLGKESFLMEDLSAQGYRAPVRQDSVDWRFACAAVSKLATFHALSFAYERDNPEQFALIAEQLKYESPKRTPEEEMSLKAAFGKMIEGAIQVVKEEHREGLLNILKNLNGFVKLKSPINRTVLAHGDYRASNIMFKEQDGALDLVIVDYQMMHSGSPVADLLYFTFMGTDQQFRRRHHKDLLQRYHEELAAALDSLGLDVEREYPRKMFDMEVKEMLPLALQLAAMVLPLVTVESAAAPQITGDAELQNMALAPNELFAERYRTLVEDCVEWGVL